MSELPANLTPVRDVHVFDEARLAAYMKDHVDGFRGGIKVLQFEGGCVTYRSSLPAGVGPVPSFDPGGGLSFVPRSMLVAFVDRDEGLIL